MNEVGVLLALTSAVIWGSGDFSGGLASRRHSQYYVLAVSAASGMVLLVVFALLRREGVPTPAGAVWAALGGLAGALGLAALYRGLSLGSAAIVAPTSAVIGAVVPVVFSALVEGLPTPAQLAGFALALAGIWLVSRPAHVPADTARRGLGLALLAGVGFGLFFILIAQVDPGLVFSPLVVARGMTLLAGIGLMALQRLPVPGLTQNPVALLAGVLDAGGNVFYVLAQQYTRLDVAAVLVSLYPASTVVLAWLLLKEPVSRAQWVGAALCLGAVALIAA